MVGERHANRHASGREFLVELCRIFHANPDPGATAPLIATTKIDNGAVAIHAGEFVTAPACVSEAKFIYVKAQAGVHAFNTENRLAIFKANSNRAGAPHVFPPLGLYCLPSEGTHGNLC